LKAFPALVPPTLDEQSAIAAILDAIDRKIDLHRRKRAVLDDLFKALLHKLMTGEIRVADLDLSALASQPASEAAA
jgi:type I restriction enzyme S subunit